MNAGKTLFAQVMEFVPWTRFARIVQRHRGNSGARTLSCAEPFRAMAFAQLTWRESRNAPRCPMHNQQRDGQMAIQNGGAARNCATVNAAGSSDDGLCHGDAGWALSGATGRFDGQGQADDFTQAGNLFRMLPADEQQNLFNNLAGLLSQVPADIQRRQLGQFDQADPAYGAGVRAALQAHAQPICADFTAPGQQALWQRLAGAGLCVGDGERG